VPFFSRKPPKPSAPKTGMPPVILLHGFAAASPYHWFMAWMLRRTGRRVINIGYNSYHTHIPEIALRVAKRVREATPNDAAVDVVTHSMGGIVLRWAVNHAGFPPVRRVVQTGPPNRGASFADWLDERWPGAVIRFIAGDCFQQLRLGPRGLCARSGPIPGAEVGVIAGGRKTPTGFNPKISGDNDFLVAVEETVLSGMKAFLTVRCEHGLLCWRPSVIRQVIHFLDHGEFLRDRTPPGLKEEPPKRHEERRGKERKAPAAQEPAPMPQ
jgi:pimeloyl-ACP methyl ester carboxylesterase